MREKILVTGATGKVGQELVPRLLGAGAGVRAATRSPERARRLFGRELDIVELDYHRAETYDAAVHWADRVFLVPAPFDPWAHETLVPFLDWAVQSGTEHMVLLTALTVDRVDDLALRKVELHVAETGVEYTFLRPNTFMQNFTRGYVRACLDEDGVFALPAGEGNVSFVDAGDVAEVAARVLTSELHFGVAHELTGPEALDHFEVAEILTRVSGRSIEYRPVEEEGMRTILRERGRGEEETEEILSLYRSVREGWREPVTGDVEAVLGRPARSFRSFAEERVAMWR